MKQQSEPTQIPEAEQTVAQRPSARARTSPRPVELVAQPGGTPGSAPQSSTAGTPNQSTIGTAASASAMAEIMVAEEVTRVRGFSGVITIVALGFAACLPLLGGDRTAKLFCLAALLAIGTGSAALWRQTRNPNEALRYSRRLYRAYGWLLVLSVPLVEYYTGYFSPVPVVLTLGIYHLGQSLDRRDSFVLPLMVVVGYASVATLVAFGVVEDIGLFSARDVDQVSRLVAVIAASAVLAVTLRMARVSRLALREAIARSNDALLEAQRRQAQLVEAHHQLDRALRVSVGKPGRYTGENVGDYRLGLVIGIGAIGEVYEAQNPQDGSRVAVKLLQASALLRDDLIERIVREGEISKTLDHPNIVRVLSVGYMPDSAPYFTMELLEGRDLATRLRQDGQLMIPELIRLAEELAAGLEYAHAAGVVHRDLKPLNIFETRCDDAMRWKILDFGISKLSSSSGTLTQAGIVGTPGYMSPEQALGAKVDHRSDLFAMALVLYRAMTGQPAYAGESAPQILFDIVYKMPMRPSHAQKTLSSDVDLVMAIALAKDPSDRFLSAIEFADALADACRRKLAGPLRTHGAELTRALPWGTSIATRPSDAP